jgi:hypothetical protein
MRPWRDQQTQKLTEQESDRMNGRAGDVGSSERASDAMPRQMIPGCASAFSVLGESPLDGNGEKQLQLRMTASSEMVG